MKTIGQVVFIKDIEAETGLTETQIRTAINHMVSRNTGGMASVEVMQRGRMWRWKGPNSKTENSDNGSLFEYLARTKSGTIIVQDENGNVYRMTELE
jgi:hypothetical protein